ncbi:hypothetical protein SKAU_G00123260 [Synaphobranchus kaupii]|uniref:Immunoglobulin V-set domain-containing protein n=1 Tax=Synaphobranchus kaupii TaxID=118154 RepID=A0A9Q1FPL9_SYNKA|nr:hypothetical protein SKAU_G00123260 [Synaphobranchus kaupii]
MKTIHSVPWMFLTVPLILETSSNLIGLYLKRKCVEPAREVMFFSASGLAVSPEDKERIHVQGDMSTKTLNVTISQLQLRDSGVFYCEFVYAGQPLDRFIPGKEDFILFVETRHAYEGLQCNCSSYPPLLYAISVAVVLLLCLLLGLAASHCGKACKRSRPQTLVPIYEEMTGGQLASRKRPHCHLDTLHQEEADGSVYINPQLRHQQENQYVNPREKQLLPETSDTVMVDNQ